jgi:diguanylate cyclase (GGDEF)-like protein
MLTEGSQPIPPTASGAPVAPNGSADAVREAWADAARAFDAWAHDELRRLIDRFDPPGGLAPPVGLAADTADAAHAPDTLSASYGRLLRAQLAVRDDAPEAALGWLERADALPLPAAPPPRADDAVAALHRLLAGERAVAHAYVTANLQSGRAVGGTVDEAWAAAGQAPDGFLGDRQRVRAAFLSGLWCAAADDNASAAHWFALARQLADAADLTALALQAALGFVSISLEIPRHAAQACGPADAATAARTAEARRMLDSVEPLLDGASGYLRQDFATKRADVAAEEGRCADALAACDALLAAGLPADQRALVALTRSRALARDGQLDASLAALDQGMDDAQASGLRSLDEALCNMGILVAHVAGRHDDEVRYLRRQRGLRAALQLDDAARRARLGGLRLDTERARREAADARARALQLRRENLHLERQADVLAEAAGTDALTGVDSRARFDAHLASAHAAARRAGRPLGLAMLDIDHFKRINDTHGHAAGDAVLRRLGALLRAGVRPGDRVARLGGEEFAIVFADASMAQARAVCERLRRRVQWHAWAELVADLPVTLSVGLADAGTSATPEAACAEADRRLYAAKRCGRNRLHDQPVAGGGA